MSNCGVSVRMGRLFSKGSGRCSVLAVDHGLSGAMTGIEDIRSRIDEASASGMDGVVLSPGMARKCASNLSNSCSLGIIVRLDQTTMWRLEGHMPSNYGKTFAISTVEDALRLGADAVICYMFTCHNDPALETESVQIAAEICERGRQWGMPVMVEPMVARGSGTANPFDPDVVASNTRIAVEIGADIVKTDWVGNAEDFTRVVKSANGTPVLLAGGPRTGNDEDVLHTVSEIIRSGAQGVVFGRSVTGSQNAEQLMADISSLIHDRQTNEDIPAL